MFILSSHYVITTTLKKYLVKQVKDIMNMTNVSCYPGYEKENFIVDTLTCCGLHSSE